MKNILCVLIVFTIAVGQLPGSQAGEKEESVELLGQVWYRGHPVGGVEVTLGLGEKPLELTLSDEEGRFRFQVAPGSYRLTFGGMPGFYEMVLPDVQIEAQPLDELIVHLPAHLSTQPHEPLVRGPERIPAPDLHLRFTPEPPMARDQVITGTVTVTNAGETPVLLPRETMSERTSSAQFLRMNLTVFSRDYRAVFNGWYSCLPPRCVELAPSASMDFPVTLFKRNGKQNEPQVYFQSGEFPLRVGLDFIPAGAEDKRTEPIGATFVLRVEW